MIRRKVCGRQLNNYKKHLKNHVADSGILSTILSTSIKISLIILSMSIKGLADDLLYDSKRPNHCWFYTCIKFPLFGSRNTNGLIQRKRWGDPDSCTVLIPISEIFTRVFFSPFFVPVLRASSWLIPTWDLLLCSVWSSFSRSHWLHSWRLAADPEYTAELAQRNSSRIPTSCNIAWRVQFRVSFVTCSNISFYFIHLSLRF